MTKTVFSHGMMCIPRQRGAYQSTKCNYNLPVPSDPVIDYCAHCLNGGTVATVKAHLDAAKKPWTIYDPTVSFDQSTYRAGLCGDPKGKYHHLIGGDFMPYNNVPIVEVYKKGSDVDFMAEIDTNHNGYFEFFLCDLGSCESSDIAPDCFKKKKCYKLLRVPHKDCEDPTTNTNYECGPIDDRYPGRWYLPCRNTGHVGVHIVGGPSGQMRFRLPADVTCKHCVIQWYWATSNSCAPRGLLDYMQRMNNPFGTTCESDGGGLGTYRKDMETCGGEKVPEEFWSCADVQITSNGKSGGTVRAVPLPNILENSEILPNVGGLGLNISDTNQADEVEQATEELKQGITNEANETDEDRKNLEKLADLGKCIAQDAPCDGSLYCCDFSAVCVYTIRSGKFSCQLWWMLYAEKEGRNELEGV